MEHGDKFPFAVHALLTDINNTLGYLAQLWTGYKYGRIDLIQASVTSNTAVDMIRSLEADFLQEFSETFTDWETALRNVFAEKYKAESRDPKPRLPEDVGFPFNMTMYSDARWSMLATLSILCAFYRELSPNCIPMPTTDDRGKYDPSADRSNMSNADKHTEDKKILAMALPEVWFLVKYDKDIPTEDGFTRGFRIMLNTETITLWTAVASQLFLDVHHILRGQAGIAFLQLSRLNMRAKETLTATITFRDGLRCDKWSMLNDDDVDKNLSHIFDEWILGDPIQKLMERLFGKTDLPQGERRLLGQNPLLCGLVAFRLQLQLQEYGIAYVDAWKSVTFAAHLYNAVSEEKYCQARWPDMDLLMRLQTPEKLYCGAPPKNVDEYYERFRLATGCLSSLNANKVTRDSCTRLGKAANGLHHMSLASLVFERRYYSNATSQDISGEGVDMLLSDRIEFDSSLDITTAVGAAFGITALCSNFGGIARDYHAWVRASMRKHSGLTERLSPMELIFATGVFIAEEVPGLYFDYSAFHRTCWEMLLSVRQALRPRIRPDCISRYYEKEDELPWIVADILVTAISIQPGAVLRTPRELMRMGREPSRQLLEEAGKAVQHFLEDGEAQGRAHEESLRIAFVRKGFTGPVRTEDKAETVSPETLEVAETMVAMANITV